MAVESKPLFHPEVLRQQVRAFNLPERVSAWQHKLQHWADLITSGRADALKESELLPDFLTDIFCGLLGYTGPAGVSGVAADASRRHISADQSAPTDVGGYYTLSRERHVEVDGEFADAVLGRFQNHKAQFIAVLEGKGTRDPLERPFAGRRMSAVDQAYRYAINLSCDWIIVTSMRETRLYYKGAHQRTYERFETVRLAADEALLKRFVFLLGVERVVSAHRECHLYELLRASETVGRALTNQFYALYADIRQRVLTRLCRENAAVAPPEILRCTQKLLDRVLFCAFCEDRGLLPAESLKRAFEHRDPYNPHLLWHNFRGLFRAIDEGNAGLNIPAYNGGLFALDPALDALQVPDEVCAHFKELGDYDYRPAREVADAAEGTAVRSVIDVDILGHIFEQSITDLERLRQNLETGDGARTFLSAAMSETTTTVVLPVPPKGETPVVGSTAAPALTATPCTEPIAADKNVRAPQKADPAPGRRRKQEGAVYTPPFITRYLVEQALGGVLKDRFETLRRQHEAEAAGTARKALADPNAYDLAALNEPQRKALIRFWEAWQEELKRLRILDPACGSGAILIEAFNQLHAVYDLSNARLEELRGQRTLFDLDRQILQNNLYGVDLNAEAIQICQLSLWIKTAARGKQLTSLDHTIREGNSVISDPAVHPKAFDWQAAFPEVFAQGGFDVVVGNPPYIRQELLAPFKPYWEQRFKAYHGVADIFVYFFEQGVEVLRPGGSLAFITSGSWVRGNFGAPLRRFLSANAKMESMVDFGEFQPFEDVEMIRPSMTVLSKDKPGGEMRLFKWLTSGRPPEALSDEITKAPTIRNDRLAEAAWELDADHVFQLRAKLVAWKYSVLKEYTKGQILYGIKTGLNEVFVISRQQRDELVAADARSAEIIKPFIQGTHLRPWYVEDSSEFLIFSRRGIRIEDFPAVHDYLGQFRAQLEPKPPSWNAEQKWPGRKAGAYQWYELQDTVDYWEAFEQPKIVWPDISKLPRFSMDTQSRYLGNTGYVIPGGDYYLLGILSSWATWFFISKTAQPLRLRGDRWQYRLIAQFMEEVPIPDAPEPERDAIANLARKCGTLGQERYQAQINFHCRLFQAFSGGHPGPLNQKAEAWWDHSLNELGDALKQSFKLPTNPMKNPRLADEWEPYLQEKQKENARLTLALADAETELNDRVYRLFNLTADEIKLLQKEVEH